MEIRNAASGIRTQQMQRKSLIKPQPTTDSTPTDTFTFSSSSNSEGLTRLGKGVGGAVAGTLFSGLLLSLPFSMGPALGVDAQTTLSAYRATVLTLGALGGLSSAAMPLDKNWY